MFKFVVRQDSPALMRMRTLVSPKTTNYAAALATAAAFARVKKNYPEQFRDRPFAANTSEESWQDFKATMGGDPRTGFFTGTTYKSIRYRMKGAGKGEIYLWGRWPNPQVKEWFIDINGKRAVSSMTEGGFQAQIAQRFGPKLQIEEMFGRMGYDAAVKGEDIIPEEAYGNTARELIEDTAFLKAQFNKTLPNFMHKQNVITGVIAAKAGRASLNDMMWVDIRGVRYRRKGVNYFIPGESYQNKEFGRRRSGMFQSGLTDEWAKPMRKGKTPPKVTNPIDVLRFKQRASGGGDASRVMLQLEAFYYKILNAADTYRTGSVNPRVKSGYKRTTP